MNIICNHPDCWDVPNQRWRSEAKRFFRTKLDNTGQPGVTPAPGEKFYFGRCEKHATPDVLNHDLVDECSREEFIAADVMQS